MKVCILCDRIKSVKTVDKNRGDLSGENAPWRKNEASPPFLLFTFTYTVISVAHSCSLHLFIEFSCCAMLLALLTFLLSTLIYHNWLYATSMKFRDDLIVAKELDCNRPRKRMLNNRDM